MFKFQYILILFAFPSQKLLPKIICLCRWKELYYNTEQCKQNTHFIKHLLDDIINNALDNLQKSSDATKITTCHTSIAQQFASDNALIPIPNDIHTRITENHRTSISISSIDESFQKLELKICELNKSVNYELALLKKKSGFFS